VNAVGARSDLAAAAVGGAAQASVVSPFMPPLPDAVVATLRTDACAALAAIMIISNAHSELLAWAQRALSPPTIDPDTGANVPLAEKSTHEIKTPEITSGTNVPPTLPAKLKPLKSANPRVKPGGNGGDEAFRARQRAQRDADDERLIEAMRQTPGGSIRRLAATIRKSRSATVASLQRLRDAGVTESEHGTWALAEPQPAPAPKPAGWIEPLSGARVARHAADGRVRNEMTLA
jgi:hypothetical protein